MNRECENIKILTMILNQGLQKARLYSGRNQSINQKYQGLLKKIM